MIPISLSRRLDTAGRRPFASHRDRRRGRRPAPRLEALEPRVVPSTLTVLNGLDSGPGSLRATIAAASSGDRINFAPSVHGIALSSGELAIATNLTIDGPGSSKLVIDGGGTGRVFDINPGVTATIDNLTITGGKAATGGGIDNAGHLTLARSTVNKNQSVNGAGGGGIRNEVGASLVLDRDVLSNNQAITAVGSDVLGGGLLNLGTAAVSNSTFTGNQALGGGSGTFFGGSIGGGIASSHGATLAVTNSTFIGNAAISGNFAGASFATGGAIESDAGVDNDQASTAVITNSTFTANVVKGGDGGTGNGGGIDNQGPECTMAITNCTLTGNLSIGGDHADGVATSGEGLGGGMMNLFGTMTVTNCTLLNTRRSAETTAVAASPTRPSAVARGAASLTSVGRWSSTAPR